MGFYGGEGDNGRMKTDFWGFSSGSNAELKVTGYSTTIQYV